MLGRGNKLFLLYDIVNQQTFFEFCIKNFTMFQLRKIASITFKHILNKSRFVFDGFLVPCKLHIFSVLCQVHSDSKSTAIIICIFDDCTTNIDTTGMFFNNSYKPCWLLEAWSCLYYCLVSCYWSYLSDDKLMCYAVTFWCPFQPLMKELDEMEKINAKLSAAVEEVTLEHCKKNEVIGVKPFHHVMDEFMLITAYYYHIWTIFHFHQWIQYI